MIITFGIIVALIVVNEIIGLCLNDDIIKEEIKKELKIIR
jgi:hypothetical protein